MATFPLINGQYFSYADMSLVFDALYIVGLKSLNYKDTLGRNFVRGTSAIPLGLTTGNYEASGDMELYLNSSALITMFPGWRDIPHVATVSYGPNVIAPLPFMVDIIAGIYLIDAEASQSQGEDALTRKFTFKITTPILWNSNLSTARGASVIGAVG